MTGRRSRTEGAKGAGGSSDSRDTRSDAGAPPEQPSLFEPPAPVPGAKRSARAPDAAAHPRGGGLPEEDPDRASPGGSRSEAAAPPGSRGRPLSIAELNRAVQREIEEAHPALWIVGEISNLSHYSSGHLYFTLKDASSEISAVMFAGANRGLRFRPSEGEQVLACGRPTVWIPRGRYQFIVEEMEPRGRGSLLEAFEALKTRLLAEGLFDPARKRAIPTLPRRIGVVTSLDGAALRDILEVLARRNSGIDVLIAPARVQGAGAAAEIASSIADLGSIGGLDVLIVGRGGGSIEDLQAFNEEITARAIAASPIPVISAVGHETDVTIADFAADVRAATPSQAAELVAASRAELIDRLGAAGRRLRAAVLLRLSAGRRTLEGLLSSRALGSVPTRVASEGQQLDDLSRRLRSSLVERLAQARRSASELSLRLAPRHLAEVVRRRSDGAEGWRRRLLAAIASIVRERRARLERCLSLLGSLSPLAVLERGYAICLDASGRRVLRSSSEVSPGDLVGVRLSRGTLDCNVIRARGAEEETP